MYTHAYTVPYTHTWSFTYMCGPSGTHTWPLIGTHSLTQFLTHMLPLAHILSHTCDPSHMTPHTHATPHMHTWSLISSHGPSHTVFHTHVWPLTYTRRPSPPSYCGCHGFPPSPRAPAVSQRPQCSPHHSPVLFMRGPGGMHLAGFVLSLAQGDAPPASVCPAPSAQTRLRPAQGISTSGPASLQPGLRLHGQQEADPSRGPKWGSGRLGDMRPIRRSGPPSWGSSPQPQT